MKRSTPILVLAVMAAAILLGTLPTTATVDVAATLHVEAKGDDGLVVMRSGCTRITNRFCTLSTRDNCSACR